MSLRTFSPLFRTLSAVVLLVTALSASAGKDYIDRLPARSHVIENFDYSSMMALMAEAPLHHIEGVWQFPSTGVKIAIRISDGFAPDNTAPVYDMILIESPNRAMRPGTVMGLISPMAKRGDYEARIYTSSVGSTLTMPKKFTLTLADDDSSLTFRQHKSAFSVNLWRLLPYLWRYTIHPNHQDRRDNNGCVRIYPQPAFPREPVYL